MNQHQFKVDSNSSCLIIGGGITGLMIATILQRHNIQTTILDKGRGIGGRLATRRFQAAEDTEGVFDYGAQYFKVANPQFQPWVDDWLAAGVIKEWCQGFQVKDGQPRYMGIKGTRGIAKYLAKDLVVHTSTKVVNLNWQDYQWQVTTEDKQKFQGDILILTPPVPQSLALLDSSNLTLPPTVRTKLDRLTYYSCIALLALLQQPSKIPPPGGLALDTEPLIWLASNYQKGISPQGYAVTFHSTPQFSINNWLENDAVIASKLLTAADWLDTEIIKYQVHRWRYSLPKTFYPEPYLALPELSLIMAGDAFVAPKIEGAALSAIAVGEYLIEDKK